MVNCLNCGKEVTQSEGKRERLYCDNKGKCKNEYFRKQKECKQRKVVLIEDERLIGRALVWKLDSIKCYGVDPEPDKWFMDRQYTIKDSDILKFKKYANQLVMHGAQKLMQ